MEHISSLAMWCGTASLYCDDYFLGNKYARMFYQEGQERQLEICP